MILSRAPSCSCKSNKKRKEKKRNIDNDLAVLPSHDNDLAVLPSHDNDFCNCPLLVEGSSWAEGPDENLI